MGAAEVTRFLSHMATKKRVTASTQRQALNALIFLYRDVLLQPIEGKIAPVRSKRRASPLTVLTSAEVSRLPLHLHGTHLLQAQLIYGAGLRLMECIRMRIQDIDFGQRKIFVRGGKGGKDRATFLPKLPLETLLQQIERVKMLHKQDLETGFGEVYLPNALVRKYRNAAKAKGWQYGFNL